MSEEKTGAEGDLQTLVDMGSGADGGVSYVKFAAFLRDCEKRAEAGDSTARDFLGMLATVAKAIRAVGG